MKVQCRGCTNIGCLSKCSIGSTNLNDENKDDKNGIDITEQGILKIDFCISLLLRAFKNLALCLDQEFPLYFR